MAKQQTRGAPRADGIDRRHFLALSAAAGAAASVGLARTGHADELDSLPAFPFEEVTLAELQALLETGQVTSFQLVKSYLQRIHDVDRRLGLNSVIETNPDALAIAARLDRVRRRGGARGPLHGIPIIVKDNIDTADRMMTSAGSLALAGTPAPQDSTMAARLRNAGAVILGKANLSEWANFRGFASSSGWSGVAGQCNNPYILDRNPCGSSSGSAASASANLCAAALGTETDGSVVCPASACGVVGIKPTVGLTSRAGVVPISFTQDTVGVHGRTVADAATVLGSLTGVDPRDSKTKASAGNSFRNYTQFVDPNGLQGARIGVNRQTSSGATQETDQVFEAALQAMRDAGADVVDPVEFPSFDEFSNDSSEFIILVFEFKRDLNAYFSTRTGVPVSTLAELIQFNLDNADAELKFFGQELLELSEQEVFSEADYLSALERGPRLAGPEGIDAVLANYNLDAIVAPTGSPAWPSDLVNGDCFLFGTSSYAAVAGYPLITVPAGSAFGLPVGMTFMASAWGEPTLIRIASGFEAATRARSAPQFLPTLPEDWSGAASLSSDGSPERQLERFLSPQLRRLRYL